jgi:hypothetical protein
MKEKRKIYYVNNPIEYLVSNILIGYEQLFHLN